MYSMRKGTRTMKPFVWFILYGLVSLLTGLQPAIVAQTAAEGDCGLLSLLLDASQALGGVHLSPTSFFATTHEYSTASFELLNFSTKSIDDVVLIAEYFDASDKFVLRIPFYATTDPHRPHPQFAPPAPQELDKVLGPGDRIVLVGTSPIISSVCPTQGRVTFERFLLSDGTQESLASSIDLDVLPDVLPAYFDSNGCRFSWPFDVFIQLRVKTSGEADIVKVEGGTQDQVACLAKELRLWTFSPALRNGSPVESRVEILLRVHAKDAFPTDDVVSQLLRKNKSLSLTVVHLLRSEDNPDHWDILYAGDCCTRVIRSRRLYAQK